jgi:hypothetical protein
MREIKAIIIMAKTAFHEMKTLFTGKLDLNLRNKLVKYYVWGSSLHGAETWDTSDSKSEIPCKFRNMLPENRGDQPDRIVKYQEILQRIKNERNILHTNERRLNGWVTICVGTAVRNTLLK